jgi:hypothetical protein
VIAEQGDKLEDCENMIGELRVEADKPKLPVELEKEIEDQLQVIYNTMSDVTNRMHEN